MNPWVSIWLKPRQTIRQIVDTDPTHLVLFLMISAGAASGLMQLTEARVTEQLNLPFAFVGVVVAVLGAVLGVMGLYVYGWLYRWVGSWFGGKAKNVEVRAAIAWVQVPTLYLFGVWMILRLISGGPMGVVIALVYGLLGFVVGIWGLVLACHTVGEVHRFSAWKGLGTLMIPNLLIAVPVGILALLAAIAIPNVLRGRTTANESAAIGNLRALVSSLEMHRMVRDGYPDSWQDSMYRTADPDFGPPSFDLDIQSTPQTIQGYVYQYTPVQCAAQACIGYGLTAVPQEAGRTGTRSFFVDESGRLHHCTGDAGADVTDPQIDHAAIAC